MDNITPTSQDTQAQDVTTRGSAGTSRQTGSIGPMIGVVIILAILALGAWYFWSTADEGANNVPYIPAEESAQSPEEATSVSTIESDFAATANDSFETQLEQDLQTFEDEVQ